MRKFSNFRMPFIIVLALAIVSLSATAQDRPTLLVMGFAHFGNPGRDAINLTVEDVLSDTRQKEIEELVDQLAKFQPTHIAIEISSENQSVVDTRYADYRSGRYELSRNESDQIGLRLAARLGHDRVYAVDWNGNPPGYTEAEFDWYNYGQKNGHEAAIARITDPENAKDYMVGLNEQNISEWITQLNDPAALLASHKAYMDIAMIGDGEALVGANWVGTWYARNLKIFSRLVNMATQPDARVLVIYGQAHAYLLQQFARESGVFELTSVETVLDN
jgi:hypothetical protein